MALTNISGAGVGSKEIQLVLLVDSDGNVVSISGGGGAATIADGADVAEGAKGDAAWTAGSGSVVALLKAIAAKIISTVAITAASLPLPAGASTEATLAAQSAKLPSALSTNGGLKISNVDNVEGENASVHRMMTMPKYTPTNINSATTTVVVSGPGTLHLIAVNKAVASATITIYDNTAGSGTVIGVITQPAALLESQYNQLFDVTFTTGLTIVTVGAQDITVSALAG